MRYYSIKNKITEQYITGIIWQSKKRKIPGHFTVAASAMPRYVEINELNYLIESLIQNKLQSALDDCEILTFEKIYSEIKGPIKLKTVRNRLEQRSLVRKLKGF